MSQDTEEAEQHRDEPEMDEEMFREWQRMQAEADSSASEAQRKASGICCTTLFQMLMVCLLVGKLEHDYPRPADGSVGYSAFWIIFPLLLLSGLTLCVCSCLIFVTGDPEAIYGNGGPGAAPANDVEAGDNPAENTGEQVIFMAPPSSTPMPEPIKPHVEAPAPAANVPPAVPEEQEDMDELD